MKIDALSISETIFPLNLFWYFPYSIYKICFQNEINNVIQITNSLQIYY